jgi:hypothetical protein
MLGNTRAEQFYEQDGWRSDARQRVATVWAATVEEIRYSRKTGAD